MAIEALSQTRVDEVVGLLGFADRPAADLDGLHDLYRAWCRRVPFDNLRKLVALHFDMPELPGIEPADFFAAWQFTGAGATCWGSNNAIHALLVGLGFDATRFGASMSDDGAINHGTTIVTLGEDRWLVDTSVLTDLPVALSAEPTMVEHEGLVTRARLDGTEWVIDVQTAKPEVRVACRVLSEIDDAITLEQNENSRTSSMFNGGIDVRLNDATGVWILRHRSLARIETSGTTTRELTDAEVDEWMIETSGHSRQMVAEVRAILDFQAESAEN